MHLVMVYFVHFTNLYLSVFTKETAIAVSTILAVHLVSAGYIFSGIGIAIANVFDSEGSTYMRPLSIYSACGFSDSFCMA